MLEAKDGIKQSNDNILFAVLGNWIKKMSRYF